MSETLETPGSTRGARTRQRLLDATLRAIAARGIGAFTVRDVVHEAESSLGVLTHHFPTRRELLLAACNRYLERQALRTPSPRTDEPARDLDTLTHHLVALYLERLRDDPEDFLAGREFELEAQREPELAARLADAPAPHHEEVVRQLRRAGSTDPHLDAELLAASLEGLGLRWRARPGDRELEALLRRATRRLVGRFFTDASGFAGAPQ